MRFGYEAAKSIVNAPEDRFVRGTPNYNECYG